jgi:hypothetical protein
MTVNEAYAIAIECRQANNRVRNSNMKRLTINITLDVQDDNLTNEPFSMNDIISVAQEIQGEIFNMDFIDLLIKDTSKVNPDEDIECTIEWSDPSNPVPVDQYKH